MTILIKRDVLPALGFILASVSVAAAAPANTLRELFPALTRCWHTPVGSERSEVTIGITLRRDGTMFGQPSITYSKLTGDADAQRRFVASTLAALAQCTPVAITSGLGGAIAGRRIFIRFESQAPQSPI
ncbi:MAG: hypothetical protein JOZ16_02495 [Methylobacteriaceae bacterium]|nr:hypothetical protein [Methylobacteriaceae bacterium]